MDKKVVVVVDMQFDFMDFPGSKLPIDGAQKIIPGVREYLGTLNDDNTDAVVFTGDDHDLVDYLASEEGKQFPPHCIRGELGSQLVVDERLVPGVNRLYRLNKGVFSMWEEPTVTVVSRTVKQITLTRDTFFDIIPTRKAVVLGVALNYCVKYSVLGLVERGFTVEVKKDLTKGIGTIPEELDPNLVFKDLIEAGKVFIS
jgi:nicotinamidase/pyrazinamidase